MDKPSSLRKPLKRSLRRQLIVGLGIVLVFGTMHSSAQDILYRRDSIRCKILKVTDYEYFYAYLDSNKNLMQDSVSRRLVDSVKYRRYKTDTIKMEPGSGNTPSQNQTSDASPNGDVTSNGSDNKPRAWKFSFSLGLNISNFMEFNSTTGPDKKNLSGSSALDLSVKYKKEGKRFQMTNELHWLLNIQKAGLSDTSKLQRVTDNLRTLHDFSFGVNRKNTISLNLIVKPTTSLLNIYQGDYLSDVSHAGRVQGFGNPYEVVLSPGIKYEPDAYLRVSLSPYSMDIYGLESQRIANTGLYTHDSDAHNNYSRFVYKELGAELNIWYDRNVGTWLQIQYRLGVSSSYAGHLGNEGAVDGLFITKIRLIKDLYLSHNGILKGDFSAKAFKPYYGQTILLSYNKSF